MSGKYKEVSKDDLVAAIPKNRYETVLAYVDVFNGRPVGHIRTFETGMDQDRRYTTKGICLGPDPDAWDRLAAAAHEIADKFRALEAA